jgi:hypothetical protein
MRWFHRHDYVRPARPKALALKADEAEQISARLKAAIDCSPVLRAFGVQVRTLRSRFYLEFFRPAHSGYRATRRLVFLPSDTSNCRILGGYDEGVGAFHGHELVGRKLWRNVPVPEAG